MGIDLNTIEEEAEEAEGKMAAAEGRGGESVCLELWHACAGPQIWLPRKTSLVVYFPQGHIEQLGGAGGDGDWLGPSDVPPHVLCRVVDVKLQVCFLASFVQNQHENSLHSVAFVGGGGHG